MRCLKGSDLIGFLQTDPGQIAGTKKPAGLAPCGLLGLHRMTLVIFEGWRNLNEQSISMKLNINITLKNNWYT
jgi:hypothetical protein